MLQPWAGLVCAAVAVIVTSSALIVAIRRRRRAVGVDTIAVANVHHAEASALFRRLRRRYHLLLGGEVAALSIVGLAAVGLTMRPVSDRQLERDVRNRDVMLCLDVSNSMQQLDAEVLREFATLAADLRGERFGLTIFNGSAITVFPLTDDPEFIATTLDEAATALTERKQSFVNGTDEGGTSLIGDGLASCAMRFDTDERGRSRSIVFATDNALAGTPILQLPAAAAMVRDLDIRVYAIAAAGRITPSHAEQLAAAAELTGGALFETGSDQTTDRVVKAISKLEASRLDVPPEIVADDRPTMWVVAGFGGLAALFTAGWALRR